MSGIQLTGMAIAMNGGKIQDLDDPSDAKEATNKEYVDTVAALDFQGLNEAVLRTSPRGRIETWTAGSAIAEGALVIRNFTNDICAVQNVYPTQLSSGILGVSASPYLVAGDPVRVVKSGGFVSIMSWEETVVNDVLLTKKTSGATQNAGSYRFLDSGGDKSDYDTDENYNMTFAAANVGDTWTITPESWGFENSPNMIDRLGIQTSPDGVTWTNASVSWMFTSTTHEPPWSSSKGDPELNGWIFPATDTISPSPGGTWDGRPVTLEFQYIKFIFWSDASVGDVGWDLNVTSSVYPSTNPIVAGSVLYVDVDQPEKVSKNGSWVVGQAASGHVLGKTVVCLF
jgi:hypothetical protein